MPITKILSTRFFESLNDTLSIVIDAAAAAPAVARAQCSRLRQNLASLIECQPASLLAARQHLDQLAISAAAVVDTVEALNPGPEDQLGCWARALSAQCRDTLAELTHLTPWTNPLFAHHSLDDFPELNEIPTLCDLAEFEVTLQPRTLDWLSTAVTPVDNARLRELQRAIATASQHARHRIAIINRLARQCDALSRMDYDFLYDEGRHLLSIGYNVTECQRDSSYYDLLASEARLATFIAIAQGQIPQQSWFALGRLLTTAGGEPILLSWSGSMFEYLMPLLVMPTYENTLLHQTYKVAVGRQIEYGKERAVPWGISECGYNAIDAHLNYQYRAFGVPGLGLKRGLAEVSGDCTLCLGVSTDGSARRGLCESGASRC